MPTLRQILEETAVLLNKRKFVKENLGQYQSQINMISRYLPRLEEWEDILPEGIDTEFSEDKFNEFLKKYRNMHTSVEIVRNNVADYCKKAYEKIVK